jgi:hypothetical protein
MDHQVKTGDQSKSRIYRTVAEKRRFVESWSLWMAAHLARVSQARHPRGQTARAAADEKAQYSGSSQAEVSRHHHVSQLSAFYP